MGFVAQLVASNVHKSSKTATKTAVLKVLRANKHLAQAVDALAKTKGRRAAIKAVIEANQAFKTALALELLKHK